MIQTNQNIAIVPNHRLEKWWCVKILIAKGNGFTYNASTKKNCHRNGTAKIAECKCKRKSERLNKFYLD
jgi:hypothetical protein